MSIQTGSFHTVCRGALGYELKGLEGNMQCLSDTVQTIRLFSFTVRLCYIPIDSVIFCIAGFWAAAMVKSKLIT